MVTRSTESIDRNLCDPVIRNGPELGRFSDYLPTRVPTRIVPMYEEGQRRRGSVTRLMRLESFRFRSGV